MQQTCEPVKTMLDAFLAKTRPVARHVRVTSARSMLDFTMALILAAEYLVIHTAISAPDCSACPTVSAFRTITRSLSPQLCWGD